MQHRFLIVEDDPFISRVIKKTLENNNVQVVGIAKNLEIALELLENKKPDLCLVDIQLKDVLDGVTFAKELDKINLPYFYLTAQTDPLTISEVNNTKPLGYIVKPFTTAGLWSSISVVWNKYLNEKENFLVIKADGYVHRIPEDNILYLEAFDNYCYVVTDKKKILVPHTLKKIREQLVGNHFFVTHRSYCVNINKIKDIGKKSVHINNNQEISLSEARKPQLLEFLKN